jgi:hypothetical protein
MARVSSTAPLRGARFSTRPSSPGLALINRDGSGLRQFVSNGTFANWSADGRWIYYVQSKADTTYRKADDYPAVR